MMNGGDLSRMRRNATNKNETTCGELGSSNRKSVLKPASKTKACGALFLSNDSHVSDGAAMLAVSAMVRWFASYSASNNST